MSSPWSFFKNAFVVSLKEATERRAYIAETLRQFPGLSYTIVDAVDGRKNPHLRKSYQERGIIDEYKHGEGVLGCLASHRMLWEQIMLSCDSEEPVWSLILEDDVKFHPLFTGQEDPKARSGQEDPKARSGQEDPKARSGQEEDLLAAYLAAVPKTARMLKLGYLGTEPFSSKYIPVNKYWTSFQNTVPFSLICYAVRSDFLPHLLKHKWSTPADAVRIPDCYGMINVEDVLDVPIDKAFRLYGNRHLGRDELFHGIVAEHRFESQIFETPAAQKYLICRPGNGVTDIICATSVCLAYAEKHNRTLVIVNESIRDHIEFKHPRIYVGNVDELCESLNAVSMVPAKLDLTLSYDERVLVCSEGTGVAQNISIVNYMKFKEPVTTVFRERRAKLPTAYVGVHLADNASEFMKMHVSHFCSPFFVVSDNKSSIDEMRYRYGEHAIAFSAIPYVIGNKRPQEQSVEENRRFVADSCVDLLLLATATEVHTSSPTSMYAQLAKILGANKKVVERLIANYQAV